MSWKTAGLPRDVIGPRLSMNPLTAQNIRALFRLGEWKALESRNSQLVYLADSAQLECGITLDAAHLADVFELARGLVRTVRSKARARRKAPYRPRMLTEDQEQTACEFIRNGGRNGNFTEQRDLLNFVETHFRKTLTHGWMRSFFRRDGGEIKKSRRRTTRGGKTSGTARLSRCIHPSDPDMGVACPRGVNF
jgi:transposase